jgi:hypothetical protein
MDDWQSYCGLETKPTKIYYTLQGTVKKILDFLFVRDCVSQTTANDSYTKDADK